MDEGMLGHIESQSTDESVVRQLRGPSPHQFVSRKRLSFRYGELTSQFVEWALISIGRPPRCFSSAACVPFSP